MNGQRGDGITQRAVAGRTTRRRILGGTGAVAAAASLGRGLASADHGGGPHAAWLLGSGTRRSAAAVPVRQLEPGNHVQAVVSSQAFATNAGLEVLAAGGTAADAAIAVAAVLSVVEPWFSSVLGGGTWALYFDAEAMEVTSLDGVGPVGSNATIADYRDRAERPGIHQANVPGAWDGWMLWLDRYGRLDLGQVLASAIRIAGDGYPVGSSLARWLDQQADFILAYPDTARIYAPDGAMLEQGAVVRHVDLAGTFEALARAFDDAAGDGRTAAVQAARDYYYRGPLAEAIVAFSDRHDGYLTLEDFHGFATEIVAAIAIDYAEDVRVYQNPPNSQGITMLLALNVLKGYDLAELDPDDPDAVHLQVEALKLAFADRHHYVGDPARIEVPVSQLLSEEYAAQQRQRIDMATAGQWPIDGGLDRPAPAHTTTFHIVDRHGNAAAVTTSLGANFLVIGETGIHINNRMRMVSLEEGNPNQLTPGYKVRHTSNPYMALRGNRPYILGGNTGVDAQPQGQLQQFLSVVEFGLSAQEAIDRPRFVSTAFPAGTFPYDARNELHLEEGYPDDLVAELAARGHRINLDEGTFGAANMIVVNEDGSDAQVGAESRGSTATGRVIAAAT